MSDFRWFAPRRYRHFDRQVGLSFAKKVLQPDIVTRHSFSPLIHYVKSEKRYTPKEHKTKAKDRSIMFASHRDACILSYYACLLNQLLEATYASRDIGESVIAYRSLGKGNYHFASDVYRYAHSNAPVAILAYDVTKFFDTLDHRLLKSRLGGLLGVGRLSEDWFKVFRYMTKFRFVRLEDLRAQPEFLKSMQRKTRDPIATIAEVKLAGVAIHENPNVYGIPQGTPISAAFSNLYMLDFDMEMSAYCRSIGALYRRYSDDILVVCKLEYARYVEVKIEDLLAANALQISRDKTEVSEFDPANTALASRRAAQYLGFTFHGDGAAIRPSSLSRQWRKMRKGFRRTRDVATKAIAQGKASKVYTKKLRKRFTSVAARNFSSYARRSAKFFENGELILRQLRRFEREVEHELLRLKEL
ncbi:Reverse transcriptase [Rhizobium leguminosarum bv. viciae]|uniref:antiviral reverse transcriptase Drt2 n=1 Tax=Rhizobium leguminosarum TaxID=384 RepID=UPI001038DFE6|nr:antiviral reverse transcriptase Drt2 [Rhizobium leguminosarum]TBZ30957.1 Reverse transcriptase [Rhizobium leguminosarum bv. viciae]